MRLSFFDFEKELEEGQSNFPSHVHEPKPTKKAQLTLLFSHWQASPMSRFSVLQEIRALTDRTLRAESKQTLPREPSADSQKTQPRNATRPRAVGFAPPKPSNKLPALVAPDGQPLAKSLGFDRPTRSVSPAFVEAAEMTGISAQRLAQVTTEKDLADIRNMAQQINPERWTEIYSSFFSSVVEAKANRPEAVRQRDQNLSDTWFHEPFYYTYVQYFGTGSDGKAATFDDLIRQLDYLEEAGIKNIFLLPHYESPMGDGGYDVSDFSPRKSLGGREAYERFMKAANERGFRIATDLPLNHTSVEHPWLQAAINGDDEKLAYYLPGIGEQLRIDDRNGDLFGVYRSPDGTITERILIFPEVDRFHGEEFKRADGTKVTISNTFYPFQLDLDLTNPRVLKEAFTLLATELNSGILGKRTDAIAHWIKKIGTTADGLPETHAVHALLKSLMRHVSDKSIVLPEAVRGMEELKTYAGMETKIAGKVTSSEGDAIFDFQMQGALREALLTGQTSAIWKYVYTVAKLPADAVFFNLLGHHDEIYLGMISEENRALVASMVTAAGGTVYKNGMSAGARLASIFEADERRRLEQSVQASSTPLSAQELDREVQKRTDERMAMSIFSLYMLPGTPVMYYGEEIGARNQHDHALRAQRTQFEIFSQQGVNVPFESAFDPREDQRGPISTDKLEAGKSTASFQMFARLNRLRAAEPSLQSHLLTDLTNGNGDVMSMVRFTDDNADPRIISLANLAGETRTLRIPMGELREKMGLSAGTPLSLKNVLFEPARKIQPHIEDGSLVMTLEPYQTMLMKAADSTSSP
jgi:maltose alpha-D-glucosyltransferase/alpha-amylase